MWVEYGDHHIAGGANEDDKPLALAMTGEYSKFQSEYAIFDRKDSSESSRIATEKLGQLPQYQRAKQKLSGHVSVVQQLNKLYAERKVRGITILYCRPPTLIAWLRCDTAWHPLIRGAHA